MTSIFLRLFPRQILSEILKNGGWTLVLLAIFVPTKRCSHLILQWTMVNNSLWATPQLPKLKDKERLYSR
ncbi:hypothetical protein LOK49_LG02G01770 [Camellia lanceoleosa]|uniref:Uncharacterized protein n=1 Tax=Camellia lanceoleosa TaxID=1840588 RepID=A0ACC0IRM0_9ERIC|nr:hypothetical protein LOK49_LG02G01770 [Camellia lanceoleosa]